jgi:hypothetical protein
MPLQRTRQVLSVTFRRTLPHRFTLLPIWGVLSCAPVAAARSGRSSAFT